MEVDQIGLKAEICADPARHIVHREFANPAEGSNLPAHSLMQATEGADREVCTAQCIRRLPKNTTRNAALVWMSFSAWQLGQRGYPCSVRHRALHGVVALFAEGCIAVITNVGPDDLGVGLHWSRAQTARRSAPRFQIRPRIQ